VKSTANRKLQAENESFAFRNEQLLKRIEFLQSTLDSANSPKSKKSNTTVYRDHLTDPIELMILFRKNMVAIVNRTVSIKQLLSINLLIIYCNKNYRIN